jgi:hypothetical protein
LVAAWESSDALDRVARILEPCTIEELTPSLYFASPASLPIEQISKFNLVTDLRIARRTRGDTASGSAASG